MGGTEVWVVAMVRRNWPSAEAEVCWCNGAVSMGEEYWRDWICEEEGTEGGFPGL